MAIEEGKAAPAFTLGDAAGNKVSLKDFRGRHVIVYFYPKDDTPGCTKEACGFRDLHQPLQDRDVVVLGVSPDDAQSHRKFAENHGLPFPLLADIEGKAADAYGVKTKMFGMTVAKRQTFVIGPDGTLVKHYEKVRPATHSTEVLSDLETLTATP